MGIVTFLFLDRVQDVKLSLHLAGVLLKTGEATDEDLQSLASMLSTNTLGSVIIHTFCLM